jgi:hypothetical protein
MEWVKLYTRLPGDGAILRAGEQAAWLFIVGLCYCGHDESDGFIPHEQLRRFGLPRTPSRVTALVREGLWLEVDGGYVVARWKDRQLTSDRLAASRDAGRVRQRRYVERTNAVSDAVTDASRPEETRTTTPQPPASGGPSSRCERHKARKKPACPDCQLPPISRPDSTPIHLLCEHGRHGPTCPFCPGDVIPLHRGDTA